MKKFQIDKNTIILEDMTDLKQDFDCLLTIKNSITYKQCNNLDIKINSSINNLTIKNSNYCKIHVNKLISGSNIINCKNIEIITTDLKPIYYLHIENCENLKIILNKKIFNSTEIDIINSDNILFIDFNKNKIFQI